MQYVLTFTSFHHLTALHSFPTRRSSDLLLHSALSEGLHGRNDQECLEIASSVRVILMELSERLSQVLKDEAELKQAVSDRKSTRLNSSHLVISYAVFCLKKKNLK